MKEVKLKRSALDDLKKIDRKEAGRILVAITEKLAKYPEQFEMLTGQFKGLRKFRVGDYRVIYAIIEETVIVSRIAHRKDAYD